MYHGICGDKDGSCHLLLLVCGRNAFKQTISEQQALLLNFMSHGLLTLLVGLCPRPPPSQIEHLRHRAGGQTAPRARQDLMARFQKLEQTSNGLRLMVLGSRFRPAVLYWCLLLKCQLYLTLKSDAIFCIVCQHDVLACTEVRAEHFCDSLCCAIRCVAPHLADNSSS